MIMRQRLFDTLEPFYTGKMPPTDDSVSEFMNRYFWYVPTYQIRNMKHTIISKRYGSGSGSNAIRHCSPLIKSLFVLMVCANLLNPWLERVSTKNARELTSDLGR